MKKIEYVEPQLVDLSVKVLEGAAVCAPTGSGASGTCAEGNGVTGVPCAPGTDATGTCTANGVRPGGFCTNGTEPQT